MAERCSSHVFVCLETFAGNRLYLHLWPVLQAAACTVALQQACLELTFLCWIKKILLLQRLNVRELVLM
jgi:hypothetical protein